MSKRAIATGLLAAFCLAFSGPARSQTIDNFGKAFVWSPSVYFSLGTVIYQRNRPTSGAIVAANPGGSPAFVSGGDYNFGRHEGWDATAGFRFFETDAVEARFVELGTTSATFNSITPGGFIGVGFTGPGGTTFTSQYQTSLNSEEVNWRHQLLGHNLFPLLDEVNFLVGVRSMHISDTLTGRLNGTVAAGVYDYRNELLGAQIGLDVSFFRQVSPFQVNAFGKIGRYHLNSSGGLYEYQGAGNTFIGSFTTEQTDSVNAREVGISAGYRPLKNVLIRAGYQALWIDNLGIASANASASLLNPALLRSTVYRENLFFQGVNFGVTISE
jgi:hypothetical protein